MRTFAFIICCILSSSLLAQDKAMSNKDAVLEKIQTLSKETTSVQADFKQIKKLSYLKEPIVSYGKFYTQGENMRWEQNKPYTYIMLVSDKGLKVKNEDKEKKYGGMAEKYIAQIRNILQSSLQANFESNTNFTPSYFENGNYYKIILTPNSRQLKKMYKNITLQFDKNTYRLKILSFVEDNGRSDMIFSSEKFNTTLDQNLFTNF